MKGFFVGVLLTLVALAAAGALVFASGWYGVAASRGPDALDRFGAYVKRQSVPEHAADAPVPGLGDPDAVAHGLEHFATNCLPCHSVPGVEGMEFHEGMLPEPPKIHEEQVQRWSDAELFWIVKHGIRMTGMPAFGGHHSDQEIGHIVAFMRHAPQITDGERQTLRGALPEGHHHGPGSAASPAPGHTDPPGAPPHEH